ncbi:F0F1 ATP synthase subunit epsilon [Marinobacter koreensis]|uniref:ATP synthase epsilon chain n=1 Tax=Marinobacter koreensis TaxID=335974 RepID=A0ABW0RQ61_9GAMM|nr:F0F1 ATP synthase subunit epsilon [Marinobacter koreensis]MCK7549222.1 F0F1 ATP synthase subunit epsilon [Marinobacter koreensis]
MKTFQLRLQDATHAETISGVRSFVGEDVSGSFGIMAGHCRTISVLTIGLARFRIQDQNWRYVAMPAAVLYFHQDQLTISTRRFIVDDDYDRISEALQQQLVEEEEKLHSVKESLHNMENAVFRRLWELGRKEIG